MVRKKSQPKRSGPNRTDQTSSPHLEVDAAEEQRDSTDPLQSRGRKKRKRGPPAVNRFHYCKHSPYDKVRVFRMQPHDGYQIAIVNVELERIHIEASVEMATHIELSLLPSLSEGGNALISCLVYAEGNVCARGSLSIMGNREEMASIVLSLFEGLLHANFSNSEQADTLNVVFSLTNLAFQLGPSQAYDKPSKRKQDMVDCFLRLLRPDFFEEHLQDKNSNVPSSIPSDTLQVMNEEAQPLNTSLLYAAISPQMNTAYEAIDANFDELIPTLRKYQRRAVHWMLQRETQSSKLHSKCPMWKAVQDLGGNIFYVNVFTSQLTVKAFPPPLIIHGGILAEEMGLGKTVEVLACILSNRLRSGEKAEIKLESKREQPVEGGQVPDNGVEYHDEYEGTWVQCEDCNSWLTMQEAGYTRENQIPSSYICGSCARQIASKIHPYQSKTTLIVCPDPILEQWQEEIQRHIIPGSLTVYTYLGQNSTLSTGGEPAEVITASKLSSYDIVLSTYSVLASDIHKDADIDGDNGKTLRHAKKYQKIPTPLTRLSWWRVCLDEAQMVQSGTVNAALMALKLDTKYRWCVSGTPINRGLEDLYGLMLFLQVYPYAYKYWWKKIIQEPCDEGSQAGIKRLTALLQPALNGVMWRTRKVDVTDELALKPQSTVMNYIDLSAVERHFYKKQHQECHAVARAALPRHFSLDDSVDLNEDRVLKPREASKILLKLLRLRQACCHPQVGSQGIKSLSQNAKPLSMDEILDMLIAKARLEAEDVQRVFIFCMNGLASIFQLENKKLEAVKAYREAMAFSTEQLKNGIQTDALQKLHTLHNLSLLLQDKELKITPTLRDSQLPKEIETLKKEYMKNASNILISAKCDFTLREDKVKPSASNESGKYGSGWWIEVLNHIEFNSEVADIIIGQIKTKLSDRSVAGVSLHGRNSSSLIHKFRDTRGLKYVLQTELEGIFGAREKAMGDLWALERKCKEQSPSFIFEVAHCGKCRGELGTLQRMCAYCKLDDLLMGYEARIFSLRTQTSKANLVMSAEDAAQAQAASGGVAGGWGRMAGRNLFENPNSQSLLDDTGRGARARSSKGITHADVFHAQSETEVILEHLASLTSKKSIRNLKLDFDSNFQQLSKSHLKLIENMREEFKPARAFAQAQRQYVYAFDELDMAMMKMQLRADGEELLHDHEKYFKLHETELVVRNKELSDEKIVATADFNRSIGTLRYLEGLANARRSKTDENKKHICPVCQEDIAGDIAVLTCGHLFCSKCTMALIARSSGNNIKRKKIHCPNCRSSVLASEIAYADENTLKEYNEVEANSKTEASDQSKISVKGSYGSKLENVVRCVLNILQNDPIAKILIFSEWSDVLELISHALNENNIGFVYAKGRSNMSKALKQFKRKISNDVQTSALLLPVKLGANGLNLIEAQHVILIEPLLDPAKEAQACGRIDRIGQTHSTFVHRFIVHNTIEENVYKLAQQRATLYNVMGISAKKSTRQEEQSLTINDIRALLRVSQI